jgi:hypothetical protein
VGGKGVLVGQEVADGTSVFVAGSVAEAVQVMEGV